MFLDSDAILYVCMCVRMCVHLSIYVCVGVCVCMHVSVCACECVRADSGVLRWISEGPPEMSYPESPQTGERIPCPVQAAGVGSMLLGT